MSAAEIDAVSLENQILAYQLAILGDDAELVSEQRAAAGMGGDNYKLLSRPRS